jgi:L-serine dehydratase
MRAALRFATGLRDAALLPRVAQINVQLYGSLGATGKGHGSDKAILLGLEGCAPESVDTDSIAGRLASIRESGRVCLLGIHNIEFREAEHLIMHRRESLPFHPNGMRFVACDRRGEELANKVYYSVGGGFVVNEQAAGADRIVADSTVLPYPFNSGDQLL